MAHKIGSLRVLGFVVVAGALEPLDLRIEVGNPGGDAALLLLEQLSADRLLEAERQQFLLLAPESADLAAKVGYLLVCSLSGRGQISGDALLDFGDDIFGKVEAVPERLYLRFDKLVGKVTLAAGAAMLLASEAEPVVVGTAVTLVT